METFPDGQHRKHQTDGESPKSSSAAGTETKTRTYNEAFLALEFTKICWFIGKTNVITGVPSRDTIFIVATKAQAECFFFKQF